RRSATLQVPPISIQTDPTASARVPGALQPTGLGCGSSSRCPIAAIATTSSGGLPVRKSGCASLAIYPGPAGAPSAAAMGGAPITAGFWGAYHVPVEKGGGA